MKKYLNPLWLAPVLWFLMPLIIIFLGNHNYREYDLFRLMWIYWLWFLWIFIMNIWNYNIVNINKWNSYNILMILFVIIISLLFFYTMTASSLDGWYWLIVLIFFYIIFALILIISNISIHASASNNISEHVSKKNILSWYNIPWFFMIVFPIIKIAFGAVSVSDIIILIPYLLILQINKNFSNAKSIYKILMLLLLTINTSIYLYVSMSLWIRKDTWYILYFPIIRIISLILLIIVWWIDKKSQNKLISSN